MKKSDFTILVADDDPDYLYQTVFNLKKAGYNTISVESQAEAEAVFPKFKQDGKKIRYQFLSVLSHELKAPLNALEGYLRMMQEKQAGDRIKDQE